MLAITHEALRPLGLRADQIKLVMNDTATCPDTSRAAASRSNVIYQQATQNAAALLMDAMRKPDGTFRTYDEMVAENIPTKYVGKFAWERIPWSMKTLDSASRRLTKVTWHL